MKKLLSLLAVSLTALVLLSSCENSDDDNSKTNGFSGVNASLSDLKDTAWFSGETEISFPYENETLYINYMPDTLNTEQWISLKENADGTFTAKIEWSKDVRQIGKTSAASITKLNGTISVKCDFFEYEKMASFNGVTASRFDVSKVPPLQAEYLSNFSGKYTLNEKNYELSVGAKLGMSASVNNYWNANVLNAIVRDDGAYDMLLAHSSSNNGSGSIDPGITGSEPFITKQGLFWNHLVLTPAAGSQWTVEWSSEWYDSPYEALNAEMNMKDTFTGPATTKITYKYNFYFGTPKLKDGGYGVEAENAVLIKTDSFDSDLPTSETWKEILARAGEVSIPEDKLADYWWYNTNSLSSLMESSVYRLTESWTPALYEYDFYLALKDKPAGGDVYVVAGNYKFGDTALIEILNSGIIFTDENGSVEYSIIDYKVYSETQNPAGENVPLQVMYLVKDSAGKMYNLRIDYYVNKGTSSFNYIKAYNPPVTAETDSTDWAESMGGYTFTGRIKNYNTVTD